MNKMIKRGFGLAAILATLAIGQAVFAMGGDYGKGDPKHPISSPRWPVGVSILASRIDRVGGHWLNGNSKFHYRGDANAFNDFLVHYAQVQQKSLILYLGDFEELFVTRPVNSSPDYDWTMSLAGWDESSVTMTLPLNGSSIRLKDIKIPANLDVEFLGTKTPEAEALLAKHKAEYDKFHSKPKPKKEGKKAIRLF